MSISRKHHFVPQIHIEKFQTTEGYHQYFIKDKKFVNKKTTIDIFSVRDLNTSLDSNGDFDYNTVEGELGNKFDSKFSVFHNQIMNKIYEHLPNDDAVIDISQESLKFFYEYGIVGFLRRKKKEAEYSQNSKIFTDDMKDTLAELDFTSVKLDGYSSEEIESVGRHFFEVLNQLEFVEKEQEKLKYPGFIPTDIDFILPSQYSCDVFVAFETSFILPDITCVVAVSDETQDVKGFKIPKINCVGVPINPYVFLQIKNNDLVSDTTTKIYGLAKEDVRIINMKMFQKSLGHLVTISKELINDLNQS